jgi:hypothetical protein
MILVSAIVGFFFFFALLLNVVFVNDMIYFLGSSYCVIGKLCLYIPADFYTDIQISKSS